MASPNAVIREWRCKQYERTSRVTSTVTYLCISSQKVGACDLEPGAWHSEFVLPLDSRGDTCGDLRACCIIAHQTFRRSAARRWFRNRWVSGWLFKHRTASFR